MSKAKQLIGLVYTGQNRADVNGDKAWDRFHGKPQVYFVFDLLSELASTVFIACNKNQKNRIFNCYPTIVLPGKPFESAILATIISVLKNNSDTGILIASTDYSLLSRSILAKFFAQCRSDKPSAFYNPVTDSYEPMISWYPPQILNNLSPALRSENKSITQFLNDARATKFIPEDLAFFNFFRQDNTDIKVFGQPG